LLAGDLEAAERRIRTGLEFMQDKGAAAAQVAGVAPLLADVLYRLGRYDEAELLLDEASRNADEDDIAAQSMWRAIRAQTLARRGQRAEAEQLAREAVALAAPTDFVLLQADVLSALAEVLDMLGRPTEAAEVLRDALDLLERKGNVVSAGKARTRLAELREAVAFS
jgi:tetratricopeptide (TPR) repeat protein